MKKTRIWGFNTEGHAERCAELLVEGGNLDPAQCSVEYHEADEAWEVLVECGGPAEAHWFRGFACGFARSIPSESDLNKKPGAYVCAACGSDDVQHAHWVNPNTNEVGGVFGSWNETDAVFCNACEEHAGIVERDEIADAEAEATMPPDGH